MPRGFRVIVFGVDKAALQFKRGAMAAADMRPALDMIARDVVRVNRATILSQGRRYGGSWHKLDPDTIKRKAGQGQSPLTLVATGALLEAFGTYEGANQTLEVTKDRIRLESDLEYADYQQGGTPDIPARPFINFMPQDRQRWAQTCVDYLAEAMKV